jgi:uncharacterized surface protein with fasciclin (FAS1) repeats
MGYVVPKRRLPARCGSNRVPCGEAFAKLRSGTVEGLLNPENKENLAAILKFLVVPGRVFSNDVLKKNELKTVHGGMLTVEAVSKAY